MSISRGSHRPSGGALSMNNRDSIELPLMDGDTPRTLRVSDVVRNRLSTSPMSVARSSFLSGSIKAGSIRASPLPTFNVEDLQQQQGTNLQQGLSSKQVQELLQEFGPNELKSAPPTPFIIIWLNQFKDVLMLVILAAGLINLYGLKSETTGYIMTAVFFGASIVNAVGEWVVAEGGTALASMCAATATVLRDGKQQDVPTRELVPGDVVQVQSGDTIPADMRIAVATDLRADESVLTGESQEVKKSDKPIPETSLEPFPANMLFASTACVSGKGTGIVTATGMTSQVGLIAARLDVGVSDLSPLQETMNSVGRTVVVAVFFIILAITVLCFFTRYQDPSSPCQEDDVTCFFLKALSQGLVLGVSVVPTTMPVMITMMLIVARKIIEGKHAIVRKTSVVETLGCCMAICSDKTGTLTEGKMTAVRAVTLRSDGLQRYSFYPTAGADPCGGVFKADDLTPEIMPAVDQAMRRMSSPPLRRYGRSLHAGIDDAHVRTLLIAASLNSYSTTLEFQDGKWMTVGNLSEGALVVAAAKAGIGPPCRDLALESAANVHPPESTLEVPFSSARKLACTVHAVKDGMFAGLRCDPDVTHIGIVKGAPDRLIPLVKCSLATEPDNMLVLQTGRPEDALRQMSSENASMADGSLRVLLLCIRLLTAKDVEELKTLEVDARAEKLTQQLAIVGAFGILDPPRATVGPAINECKSAGVRVVMITGDQHATATAIGLTLNIIKNKSEARLCADLYDVEGNMVPEEELDLMVERTRVWARAQPSDKVAIVESLQRMGYVTAMTGDGVNDAPALKLADIGTAMGITGTEVAKGSADIVLMNDDFTTIVDAVQEGRRTYANIQTYVTFYVSMSIPELLTYSVCMLGGLPLPVTSLQVLVQALLANTVPPFFYYKNPANENAMKVSPRKKDGDLIASHVWKWIVLPWSLFWLFGWVFLSSLGLWMHTGFMHGASIVGSSDYQAVEKNLAACEFALSENSEGKLVRDPEPFHCLCPVRSHILDEPENLEQWGRTLQHIAHDLGESCEASDQSCVSLLRSEIGSSMLEMRSGTYRTPLYEGEGGVKAMLKKCTQDSKEKWCWIDSKMAPANKPVLDLATNCATLGSNVAHTMSFLGTVLSKFGLLFAVSSELPLIFCFFLNRPLAICVMICFFLTFVTINLDSLTGTPFPDLQQLAFDTLLTTVAFPVVAHLGLEVCKTFYRSEVRRKESLRMFHAQAIAKGFLGAQADEDEIEAYQRENPELSFRTFQH